MSESPASSEPPPSEPIPSPDPSVSPAASPAIGEIQEADPGRRVMVLTIVLAVCGLGLWAVWDLRAQIDAALNMTHVSISGGARSMVRAADDFFRMVSGWCLVLALYLGWLGAQILRFSRYPVPGAKVIRDTRVVGGWNARLRGLVAVVLALTFLGGSVILPRQGGKWVRELLAEALVTPDPDPIVIDPDALPPPGSPPAEPLVPRP